MLTAINKYPFFDISEIIPDNDLELKPYKPLLPVKAGNFIPDLTLNKSYANWQQFYNGSETHGPVLLLILAATVALNVRFLKKASGSIGVARRASTIKNRMKPTRPTPKPASTSQRVLFVLVSDIRKTPDAALGLGYRKLGRQGK